MKKKPDRESVQPAPSGQRLLSIKQLAERWGWSYGRIYRLACEKRIPHLRLPTSKGHGGYFFEEAAVEAWLSAARVANTTQPSPARSAEIERQAECDRLGIPRWHEFN